MPSQASVPRGRADGIEVKVTVTLRRISPRSRARETRIPCCVALGLFRCESVSCGSLGGAAGDRDGVSEEEGVLAGHVRCGLCFVGGDDLLLQPACLCFSVLSSKLLAIVLRAITLASAVLRCRRFTSYRRTDQNNQTLFNGCGVPGSCMCTRARKGPRNIYGNILVRR